MLSHASSTLTSTQRPRYHERLESITKIPLPFTQRYRTLAAKAVERLADDWERLVSAPRSVEMEWKEIPITYAGR